MGVSRELPPGAPLLPSSVGIYRLLLSMSAGPSWMMIDTSLLSRVVGQVKCRSVRRSRRGLPHGTDGRVNSSSTLSRRE